MLVGILWMHESRDDGDFVLQRFWVDDRLEVESEDRQRGRGRGVVHHHRYVGGALKKKTERKLFARETK